MAAKKNGARLLIDCLMQHEVEYIFGIPGAKVDAVFDALVDNGPKLILCRHEQNAAFMAGIYGRITGKPGVVLVTSGPGISNLATGLLTATTEGDPIVAIGANVPRSMRLKQSHQSVDNVSLLQATTKHSVEVPVAENIPEIVENAFRISSQPRRGATFISIPQDILVEPTKVSCLAAPTEIAYGNAPGVLIKQAAELINEAKQPVILLGLEASKPNNTHAIRELLMKTPIATVGTFQAAGVLSKELVDCFVGRVGLFKNQPGDKLLDAADVILTIGYDPVEYDPETWNAKSNKHIIHLDTNLADIHATYLPDIELTGCITTNVKLLSQHIKQRQQLHNVKLVNKLQTQLLNKINSGANYDGELIHPLRFIHDLKQVIDKDTTVISDVGTHYMWLARYLFSYEPHHLLFSNGQQTLGVALPWALATTLVRSPNKVISISGDGGFLFSAMELETAVREQRHFVHCVWCDGSYNMVLEQQVMKYKRPSGVEFGHIDICKFAESFGAKGYKVRHSNELIDTFNRAFTDQGPVLIEIPIDYRDNQELFAATNMNVGN